MKYREDVMVHVLVLPVVIRWPYRATDSSSYYFTYLLSLHRGVNFEQVANIGGRQTRGGVKQGWGRKNSQFSANNSPYLRNGAR